MTPENFTFWLKGYMEQIVEAPTAEQWEKIKTEMQLSLQGKTTMYPGNIPRQQQQWQTPMYPWPLPPTIICGAH